GRDRRVGQGRTADLVLDAAQVPLAAGRSAALAARGTMRVQADVAGAQRGAAERSRTRLPEIHPTAIVDREAELADDVSIGPYCVIRGRVRIGAGTQLYGSVHLQGPLELGARNRLWPFVALGFAPQHLGWDPDRPGAGLAIGDENTFRESVTISRAASDEVPTRVGSRNYWMTNSHAGHDCEIGSGCVIANGTLLAGSVRVGDGVVTGGNVAVHQFCQVGRGALLCGTFGLNKDLPPFFMLTGGNIAGSINLIGMRRSGMPHDQIDDVRW